jgi:tetratricopeptide (TPR) repeat protein
MNIIEEYQALVDNKDWEGAIRIVQEIIKRNPNIDTSWFNYGVCLDELGDHVQAANAFLKAHELNIRDFGIHFRLLRSFYLAGDYSQFIEFANYLCLTFPEAIPTVIHTEHFPDATRTPEFLELKRRYSASSPDSSDDENPDR